MELYTRNFLDGLTADEEKEYERILNEETKGAGGFGRKNLYHLYPEAARHFRTLFPNHHLDIVDVKANSNLETINKDFKKRISHYRRHFARSKFLFWTSLHIFVS